MFVLRTSSVPGAPAPPRSPPMTGLKIGLVAAPFMLVAMILRDTGPVPAFLEAGADAPERARRPSSIGVDEGVGLRDAVRARLLVATGDGRYWVDRRRWRRHRQLLWALSGGIVAVGAGLGTWWLVASMG